MATSGIAGPGGATPDNPVGTVWIAYSDKHHTVTKNFSFRKTGWSNSHGIHLPYEPDPSKLAEIARGTGYIYAVNLFTGQTGRQDSLIAELKEHPQDTVQVNLLNAITRQIMDNRSP